MRLVMHGTRLAGREVLAAFVDDDASRGRRAAAERNRSGRQHRALAHQYRDDERGETCPDRSHLVGAGSGGGAMRATWIDDPAGAWLVHAATTASPAEASAG